MKFLGVLTASIAGFVAFASNAKADPAWQQQPGLAVDIGVAANDIPWIVDINGNVQYGILNRTCSPSGLCFSDGTVTWHMTAGRAAHVAVSLENNVMMTDPSRGEVWGPQLWGDSPCYNQSNWMSGFDQWYGMVSSFSPGGQTASIGQFAIVAGWAPANNCDAGMSSAFKLYGISSIDSSVQTVSPTVTWCDPGGHFEFCFYNTNWLNTGGIAIDVALFSEASGQVVTQNAWAVTSGGDLYFSNPGGWTPVERPTWSTNGAVGPIRYATDSWVLAGNWVWHWNGGVNAEHKTGVPHTDYDEVIGGGAFQIKKIAFANPYPALSGFPGSRLWAIDTAGNIYTATDIVYTGQSTNGGNGK